MIGCNVVCRMNWQRAVHCVDVFTDNEDISRAVAGIREILALREMLLADRLPKNVSAELS